MAVDKTDFSALQARMARLATRGVSVADLQRATGMTYTKAYRLATGARKRISEDEFEILETFITEQENRIAAFSAKAAAEGEPPRSAEIVPITASRIPLYAAVGGPARIDPGCLVEMVERLPSQSTQSDAFALEVYDEAMSPRYETGERAFCLRNRPVAPNHDAVIELTTGELLLRRYLGTKDGFVYLGRFDQDKQERRTATEIAATHRIVGRAP